MKLNDIASYQISSQLNSSVLSESSKSVSPLSKVVAVPKSAPNPVSNQPAIDLFDLQPHVRATYPRPSDNPVVGSKPTTLQAPLEDFSLPKTSGTSALKVSSTQDNANTVLDISDRQMDSFLRNAFKVFNLDE